MKEKSDSFTELSELLGRLRDGTIIDQEFAHLDQLLTDNPQFQNYYIDYILLCSELRNQQAATTFNPSSIERSFHEECSPEDSEALETESLQYIWQELADYEKNGIPVEIERVEGPVKRVLTEAERDAKIRTFLREEKAMEEEERRLEQEARWKIREHELRRRQRAQQARRVAQKAWRYLRNSLIAAIAAMLMVIGYLLYVIMQPMPPAFVATLTDGVDVKWGDSGQSTDLDTLLRPGIMKLVEGIVEITFVGGAVSIIEAPAEIELQSADKAYLQLGKMSATVPVEARGFTVNTPSASIVDLGTEFEVHVKEDGSSDVRVFKGKVSLLAGKIDDMKVEQIVEAGQARRVKVGIAGIDEIQFSRARLARNMPSSYQLAVHKTDPIAYWDFNLNESQCHNQIEGKIKPIEYSKDVLRINNGPKLSDESENGALTILHQCPPTMRLVNIPLHRKEPHGFTMMFWYRPLVSLPHTIITQDLDKNKYIDFGRWFDMKTNGKLVFGSGTGMNSAEQYRIIETNKPLPLNQWTFVVVTITPEGQGWLYINGRRESSKEGYEYQFDYKYQPDPQMNYADIIFGFADEKNDSCWDIEQGNPIAIIDELAVYDYALSENTIRQLYNYYQPELND